MKIRILGFIFMVFQVAVSSCKKEQAVSEGTYNMQMRMTDKAGPYDEVWIDVQRVEVNTGDDTSSGWITLNTHAGIYDITKFTDGDDTLLASGSLNSGHISQIRLILGTRNSVVVDGQSYPMKTPSAQQSGLKLQVHYDLQRGITYTVLLDFDASRSIVKQGNGNYLLKPVIHTRPVAESGAIEGNISPPSANPTVYAISGDDSTGTYASFTGNFMISGLKAGTYNVAFVQLNPLPVKLVNQVVVENGKITQMGTVVLP